MNYNALSAIEDQAEMLREYGNYYLGRPSTIIGDFPREFAGSIAYVCNRGDTMYLQPAIQTMLESAMETLPDNVPLLATDVPFRNGFLKLGKAINIPNSLVPNAWDEITHLAWNALGIDENPKFTKSASVTAHHTLDVPSAVVFLFGHTHRGGHRSPLQNISAYPWGYGKALDDDAYYREFEREYGANPIQYNTRIDGERFESRDVLATAVAANTYFHQITAFRWMFAIWHFMAQKVAAKERHFADRAMRKRLEVEPDSKWVDIITLRESATAAHREFNESSRHVSVRFVVRGHWRNQWYATEQRNKPIWIMPYIKGPDGAPVSNPTKLFNIAR